MNEQEIITNESKFEKSCLLNKIYSTWVFKTYFRGLKNDIKIQDLYKSPQAEDSKYLSDVLEKNWEKELKRNPKNPSFTRATIKSFGLYLIPTFLLMFFEEVILRTVQPLMLAKVVEFFVDPKPEKYKMACLNAFGVVAASFCYILCHHPACYNAMRLALKIRVAWCTLMYKKALRLHNSAFSKTTVGQILNLMSNDVNRVEEFCIICSYLIVAPVQTIVGFYICYLFIGYYSLIGLGLLLLFIPSNGFIGRIFLTLRTKVAGLSDIRIRILSDILKGMRVIKMYAWEKHFSKLISEARRKEMVKIRQATFLRAMNISISVVAGRIVLFAIFITYVIEGNTLNADKVFVVMLIVEIVRHTMTWLFTNAIALTSELFVSCKRVQRFLLLEEIEHQSISYKKFKEPAKNEEPTISMQNVDVVWAKEQTQPSLIQISLGAKTGELIAVIGSVGSGKSTLLMSMMNEVQVTSGSISIKGNIAYASQEPWSFNGTIQENILFGKSFNANNYNNVIKVCAMKRDLEQLPYGDKTLVGERGVSLSGGQKARLTLARALYNDADIYLLDDPLSAVDAEVANHIFEKCIYNYLRNKTVVLVTHQIQFIKKATRILVLKDGKQLAFNTYDEIINSGIDLISLIKKPEKENDNKELMVRQDSKLSRAESVSDCFFNENIDEPTIVEETKTSGSIGSKIYVAYIKSGSGIILMMAMIISTIVSQVLLNYNDIWLSNWTSREDEAKNGTITNETKNTIIYTTLVVGLFITMIIRSATFFAMCIFASINLHNKIFYCLMRAPISFFDNVPVGRILNRFTKDMGIIDEQLPLCAFDLNLITTRVIGTVIVVALSQWFLIFPAIVLIVFIILVRAAYIRTARDIKRYEGIARSPLFNHMTVTLNGLATIRAFEVPNIFTQQYYRYQNDHTATYFMCFASTRFLGFVMDILCISYISIVALSLMVFWEGLESGTAGLAFSMSLTLTGVTQWGVRQSAEVENQMTSVERIIEYSNIQPEAELTSDYEIPENWPQHGHLIFDHVYLTYDNSQSPVLKDLCFEIRAGEKVGIIGRTGAGKSSILSALFRMVEVKGKIILDDIDCRQIGLHQLRSKMSIIPQEPVAFIGTLRMNLDPFDEHSDEELWSALDKVQLKTVVNDMQGKLQYELSEGGSNLSVGQRQLICLARALLRNNKILVLDEATANVDHRTDALIQKTIRNNFSSCTVITIAHRLNTIIDSDRILVLDGGMLCQYDTPYNLLQDQNGIFYNLIQQTGSQMAQKLTKVIMDSQQQQ